MIGILGDIRFQVSDREILTFSEFKREVSAAWSSHERAGKKPLPEFGAPGLQSVSMTIKLDASLGVRPRKLLEKIVKMVETGETNTLIIGKKRVGKNKWAITKSSEAWDTILSGGELLRATVSITLQEYV